MALQNVSRRWVPHLLFPTQQVVCVEALTETPRTLGESEANHFGGIATGDQSWTQPSYPSSKYLHDRRQMSFQGRGRPLGQNKL
jgi:hypothetical protein